MPLSTASDRLHLLARIDSAGRVRRRAEQQHLRPLGARCLELLDGGEIAGGQAGRHLDRNAAGEADALRVSGPVRRGQQHLIAWVEQGRERLVDRLLAAVGHQHLTDADVVAGVARGLGDDRLLQLGQAPGGRVVVHLRVAAGGDGGLDDHVRGREVRLTRAEADHVAAGRLQRLRLGVDR
jgi:hypothetical protein